MRAAHLVAVFSLFGVGSLVAGGRASAQVTPGGNNTLPTSFHPENTVSVPTSSARFDTIVRMRAADPDGDLRTDAFVRGAPAIAGSSGSHEIVFLFAPWAGSAWVKLAQTANDFDVQPATTGAPATPLAIVGANGLELVSWNPALTPPFQAALVTADAAWIGAVFVRCADLDGAAGADYVGVGSDRRTVLLRSNGGTVSFATSADVVAIEPLQWISGGAQEVAVLTANGLRVHHADGTLADDFPWAAPKASTIAVVRYNAAGPDRIARASAGSAGQPWALDVVRRATPQVDPAFALPFADVVGMSAADMDDDGDRDLVVASSTTQNLRVYSNGSVDGYLRPFGANRSLSVSDPVLTPVGVDPYAAAPVFADFGNDQRADLLVPVQVSMLLNGQPLIATRFELLRSLPAGAISSEVAFGTNADIGFTAMGTQARLSFSISSADFHGEATHVQVLRWTQANAGSYLDQHSDGPRGEFTISGEQYEPLTRTDDWAVEIDVPLPNGDPCAMPIRWIELRMVQLDANYALLRAWPTYVCAILTQHADYCALVAGNSLTIPLVTTGEQPSGVYCSAVLQNCIDPTQGSWPSAVITRRRKADPPPGTVPIVPVYALDLGTIPVL